MGAGDCDFYPETGHNSIKSNLLGHERGAGDLNHCSDPEVDAVSTLLENLLGNLAITV